MKDVKWWKLGAIRVLAIVIAAIALNGLADAIRLHAPILKPDMSPQECLILALVAISLFVLAFRTERNYEEIEKQHESMESPAPGGHHNPGGGRRSRGAVTGGG